MRSFYILIIILGFISCKELEHNLVYYTNDNSHFPSHVAIFAPQNSSDSILILNREYNAFEGVYSFHTVSNLNDSYLLKNTFTNTPKISILKCIPDSIITIGLVNDKNERLNFLNPMLSINDSIQCQFRYQLNCTYINKIDSIYKLKLDFQEGFSYFTENIQRGKIILQISNYNPKGTGTSNLYCKDYTINSKLPLNFSDTTTLKQTTISFGNKTYKFNSLQQMARRDFRRYKKHTVGKLKID